MKKGVLVFLLMVILLFASAAAGVCGGTAEEQEKKKAAEEKPFAGTEIVHLGIARGCEDAFREFIPQFEEETGIKVNLEQYEYATMFDKMMLEFTGETGAYDVFYLSPGYIGAMLKAGYILPVDDYIKQYNVDLSDFIPISIDAFVKYPGTSEMWGLPFAADALVMPYRKDLFEDPKEKKAFREKYGYDLRPPRTPQEHMDTAEFFTRDTDGDGEIDLYGFGYSQGGTAHSYFMVLTYIWNFGGGVFDEKTFEVTLNTPKNVEALKWGKKLMQYSPKEQLTWMAHEHNAYFTQGKFAMTWTWIDNAQAMIDPEKSELHDKIAFAPIPAKYIAGGGGLAISKHSKNPEAAFQWVNYINSKAVAVPYFMGGGKITRKSAYEEVQKKRPELAELFKVHFESLETTAKSRIIIPEAWALQEELHLAWSEFYAGHLTAEEALERAHNNIKDILTKAGYYK